ncbi:hypothetical protein UY3_01861 [Chelonia mydas]|uniref:Myb/SANT-like DNA-binding domain-containing protein n=1 Tax=Chelonia mydas TaxID=8469 RepID=M7BYG9_CHEMY|nr:hypothetical protein UY3_01861 [Chelonia mydas]
MKKYNLSSVLQKGELAFGILPKTVHTVPHLLLSISGLVTGTFECGFPILHGELISTRDHTELISTGDHGVPELQKSFSMDRTGGTGSDRCKEKNPCRQNSVPKGENANIFAKISKGIMDRGYNGDTQQCRVTVKELRQAYQKTKDANGHSGSDPHTCHFYDELHAILGSVSTTTPPVSMDTCKGGVSHNRDEDFVEEEFEDSAQQASRESLLPGSQELFITLEPIPSQGGLPDHEAGEGTSAANVSTLPLSSSSHRLAQIRR